MNALAEVKIYDSFLPAQTFSSFGGLISVILPNIYILAGLLLFVLIIIGGFGIVSGGMRQDPRKTGQGANALVTGLIGFLIIFTSYWIIQIVEQITGIQILNSPL